MEKQDTIIKEKPSKVTKDMIIGEAVQVFPEIIDTLLSYELTCIGCSANPLETIEQGAKGHGISDEKITEMVDAANKIIAETRNKPAADEDKNLPKEITLTAHAAKKVQEMLKNNNKVGHALRFASVRGGCSGWRYDMTFDDSATDKDLTFEQHGVKVFVDKESIKRVGGCIIDYTETLKESGFKITNPAAEKNCGCGKSFG